MRKRGRTLAIIAGLCALALPVGIFLGNEPDTPPAPIPGYKWAGDDRILPRTNGNVPESAPRPANEFKAKQQLLNNDIALTNALCRSQCRNDLKQAAAKVHRADASFIRNQLRTMKRHHPHMERLEWVSASNDETRLTAGELPPGVKKKAMAYMKKAKAAIRQGKPYESERLQDDNGEHYFVLGVPSPNKSNAGIAGLVHQDVLRRVERHQIRNLRLKAFPEVKRYGIRAIDPQTGKEVDVDNAEENQGVSHYIHKEVVVRFENNPSIEQLRKIKKDLGVVEMKKLGYAYVFEAKDKSTKDMLDYFQTLGVQYAEPHYLYVTNETEPANPIVPNDALYSRYQWNLPIIGTPSGWEMSRGNERVTVAVIDTGVDLTHPDLKDHLVDGYNIVDPAKPPEDDVGHGTHVAGVISALTDNGEGVAGMTWYNRIMPIKVLDSSGMGSTYSVAEGIIWATDRGAKVINMSLGNYASAQFLHDAVRYAFDKDVVLVAATGNDNTAQPGFPAAYPEVFAVSATNVNRQKASFSNYGDYVDVVAPGENIASTYMDHQYAALSGTSMASPHVTALAALIRSVNPELKNTEVYDLMRQSAMDLGTEGFDSFFGHGQIDVARALQLADGQAEPPAIPNQDDAPTADRSESFLEWLFRLMTGSAR